MPPHGEVLCGGRKGSSSALKRHFLSDAEWLRVNGVVLAWLRVWRGRS